ncbi:hypothetical protein AB0D49_14875 [Streptomyces sp. NPDC048290]|uniref:hypothetical protein n=1 Tax=Streptomyces sp. NPDC048290 TaxID=3155811 RepID=UPI0034320ABC
MSTSHHSRKSPPPQCELREDEQPTCVGPAVVVLVIVGAYGREQRVCASHAAALWLTDPTIVFSTKTGPEAIKAVMRQAFGTGGSR